MSPAPATERIPEQERHTEVRVGPPTVTIWNDDAFLVCAPDATMSSADEQGYFATDTRLVSGYRLRVGRLRPVQCNASAIEHHSARFEFLNPAMLGVTGEEITEHVIHLRLDRTIGHGIHEDYDLTNYSGKAVVFDLEVSLESDFADIFDVKNGQTLRRGALASVWSERRGQLVTKYANGKFERSIVIEVVLADSPPAFVNGGIAFRVELKPGASWHTCMLWRPSFGQGRPQHPVSQCHALVVGTDRDKAQRKWVDAATRFSTSDPGVTATVRQAVEDLASMRMERHDEAAAGPNRNSRRSKDAWVPAGGVPWFVSLFGRDALTVSLQTVALSSRFALGSLSALGSLQADDYDDARDMQPGKIEHEIRHGELASLHLVPHTPYYGSHEATSLYVLTAATAWRWHGDRAALDAVRPNVERALSWIDTDGDIDGDGLQEYKTRAPNGYYNQGWKDSGDAIVGRDGRISELPIALCEHQGLVVAAKRAWADVVEYVYNESTAATQLRSQGDALAEQIESRFWWPDEGTYYLGLDGHKNPIESVTSNPGLLLWLRTVTPERASSVATRLLADDMWSGWGIRTLSSAHPSYNPFSYQLGSVWPHDNAFAASGLRNYGLDTQACQVARGFFDAAERFAARRLPELFAGLERDNGSFPVQYLGANVPQAWASGAVVQIVTALLGLDADASAGELEVRPALPGWLTEITVERLTVGKACVDLRVRRRDNGEHDIDVSMNRGHLDVRLET